MKIAVLCGGRSHERAVSLRSGARVEAALHELGHQVDLVDVDRATSRQLRDGTYDCAFIALHGRGGEDGSVQALCELVGVPYTGSRPGPCECAFDKVRAKRMLRAAGVTTPKFISLTETALQEFGAADALTEAHEAIGFPMVVKPATGGSSLGVRFVDDEQALPHALVASLSYDRHVVIERYIAGREVAVTVLGTDAPTALPPVGIVPRRADWYDFESRYSHGETEFSCPADSLTSEERAVVERVAIDAYRALDLSGFGRVDMIVDEAGTPWVLELATVPGLTETSLLPLAAEAGGLSLADVCSHLVDDALARHGDLVGDEG